MFASTESIKHGPPLDKVATRGYFDCVRSVGIKELKNKLSEYIRLVSQGETVLVTDRDRVVAEIIPLREGRSEAITDAFLAEAVKNGWVTPPAVRQVPPRKPVGKAKRILADLTRAREDR